MDVVVAAPRLPAARRDDRRRRAPCNAGRQGRQSGRRGVEARRRGPHGRPRGRRRLRADAPPRTGVARRRRVARRLRPRTAPRARRRSCSIPTGRTASSPSTAPTCAATTSRSARRNRHSTAPTACCCSSKSRWRRRWRPRGAARRKGVPVILDPAPASELTAEAYALVDVLAPNQVEAAALVGYEVERRQIGGLSGGKRAAAQRRRDGGREAWRPGAPPTPQATLAGHVPPFDVEAVDTVAAGDAFGGALGVALAECMDLAAAIRFASAAGAVAVTRPGAQTAMPSRERGRGPAAGVGARRESILRRQSWHRPGSSSSEDIEALGLKVGVLRECGGDPVLAHGDEAHAVDETELPTIALLPPGRCLYVVFMRDPVNLEVL